jgi:hypothetical protein
MAIARPHARNPTCMSTGCVCVCKVLRERYTMGWWTMVKFLKKIA